MKKILVLFIITLAVIASCNIEQKEQRKFIQDIADLESALVNDSNAFINKANASKLIELYNAYLNKYPDDTLTGDYLFKAGELSMNLMNPTQAIIYLSRFEREHANHPKIPYCIFFQAFIYENQLNNLEKAEDFYRKFIERYPDHDLADDAEISIQNLGKPLEEIIRDFENNREAVKL